MAPFAIGDSLCLAIELHYDVHQANGNKLQKLDGCVLELDDESVVPHSAIRSKQRFYVTKEFPKNDKTN